MKRKVAAISTLLIMVLALSALMHKSAPAQNTKEILSIEFTQGLITAKIENVPLEQVLSAMQKKAGIKVHIMSSSLAEKHVTLSIQNADPEHFLKALLGENYVFSFQQASPGTGRMLSEIWVASKSLRPSVKVLTKEINYGSGKENIGSIRAGEGANMGPESFTIDPKGNIYICDTVNKRIQIFSHDGKYLSSIYLNGQMPGDISVDKNGFLYVYADSNLYQYDNLGNRLSEIPIDQTRWDSKGPMHIIDNSVFIRGSGRGDGLIAHIENGKLIPPSNQELQEPLQDGTLGLSGARYVPFPKNIEGPAIGSRT